MTEGIVANILGGGIIDPEIKFNSPKKVIITYNNSDEKPTVAENVTSINIVVYRDAKTKQYLDIPVSLEIHYTKNSGIYTMIVAVENIEKVEVMDCEEA